MAERARTIANYTEILILARSYINENLTQKPMMRDFAREQSLAERSVQRALEFHHTRWRKLVRTIMMTRASMWMRTTNHGDDWISMQLGFSETRHFQRAFERQCGVTTGRFRRDIREEAESATAEAA